MTYFDRNKNHEGLTFTSPFSPVQPLTYVQQNLEGGHRDTQWPFHKLIHVDTENKVFEHNYIIEYKISEEYQSYWFIPYDMWIDDRVQRKRECNSSSDSYDFAVSQTAHAHTKL
ncbi:hypothetical protein OUZ56_012669 [Daphnia magna]|uniref:Uncharacterized protein n=1 Tax=Daphnia magna TaxID=35525 RepID=A0ABQ9Z3P2_9CRUS|nr:hypothetical protein OUZ56_012669 [Daphnia magna]